MNTASLQTATTTIHTINQQLQNFCQALEVYEPVALFEHCLQVQRITRELLLFADVTDNFFEYTMLSLNLADAQNLQSLNNTRQQISDRVSPAAGDRFYTFLQMCASIHQEFLQNGVYDHIPEDAHMYTIGEVLRYFEMRSRHLNSTLLLIPHICKGQQQFDYTETLKHLLYPIENNLLNLDELYFTLIKNEAGITAANDNSWYNELRYGFTHPVYIASSDQEDFAQREYQEIPFWEMPAGRVDAYVNVDNSLLKFRLHFQKYAVTESALYQELDTLIQAVKPYCTDEYFINVPLPEFEKIENGLPQISHLLTSSDSNYSTAIHAYPPFVVIDGKARGTVTSLTSFVNLISLKILHRNKQFQADTKASFETKVGELLQQHGFELISHQQATLVATKENTTYTFYLKSNPVDVIRTNFGYKQVARLNTLRVNSYQRQLNAATQQSPTGKHVVVSRTPILTPLPNIVGYGRLDAFLTNC